MKPVTALLYSLFVVFYSTMLLPAQDPHSNVKPSTGQTVKIGPIKQLRKGVDAWPLIENADSSTARRVNATLMQMNRKLKSTLRECDTHYLMWAKLVDLKSTGKASPAYDWERKVKVTMAGPHYLSIVATDDFVFCGGAHPDSDRNAMVFDMTTGALVDWSALVAKSAGASSERGSGLDGATASRLFFPALEKINASRADAECKDAFWLPQSFLIWPDADKGGLIVQEADLPHVVQACANEIDLTLEQARKLGFDESLLTAIKQAHGQIAATPKP